MRRPGLGGGALGAAFLLFAFQAVASSPAVETLQWRSFDEGLPRDGQWREGFALADLDGDGYLDLVSGPPRRAADRLPRVFLGNGEGRWRRWTDAAFPTLDYDYGGVAAGDVNGDGRVDLALGMHLTGVVVLVATEPGRFEVEESVSGAFSSVALETVDWDGDGRLDVLALGEGPMIRPGPGAPSLRSGGARGLLWLRRTGERSWRSEVVVGDGGDGAFGRSLRVADLDGDGVAEAILGSRRMGDRRLVAYRAESGGTALRHLSSLRGGALSETVGAGDLDGDGVADLVVGYRARDEDGEWISGVDLLHGSERRTPLFQWSGPEGVQALDLGDVDGDGRLDVLAGGGDGRLRVVRGIEGGWVLDRAPRVPDFEDRCAVSALRLADLDGDGRSEVAAFFSGEPGAPDGCPGGGAIRVWKTAPRTTEDS